MKNKKIKVRIDFEHFGFIETDYVIMTERDYEAIMFFITSYCSDEYFNVTIVDEEVDETTELDF